MGFSHSWMAVKGLTPDQAIVELGAEIKQVLGRDYFPEGIAIGQMPDGWLIILTDRDDDAFEGRIRQLAKFGPAVACKVIETVMYSEARGYVGGEQAWRVVYDCEKGRYELEVEGTPPPQLDTIHRELRALQEAGEDDADLMFDTPAKLAESICGFMLGVVEPEGFYFTELQPIGGMPAPVAKPGFFAKLFGRS